MLKVCDQCGPNQMPSPADVRRGSGRCAAGRWREGKVVAIGVGALDRRGAEPRGARRLCAGRRKWVGTAMVRRHGKCARPVQEEPPVGCRFAAAQPWRQGTLRW